MATTSKFRNKQWFKNLSDKEKKDICKRHLCTEVGLKKSGYIGDDGRLKIDLLRLDCNYIPDHWKTTYSVVMSEDFKILSENLQYFDNNNTESTLDTLESMYRLFYPDVKFKKADVKKCKIWIDQTKLSILNNIKDMESDINMNSEESVIMCYSNKIYTHLNVLFNSDIKNIKV